MADEDRQAAQPVPGGYNALGGENEDGGRAVNDLLGMPDALNEGALLVDEGGGELGGIHLAGAHSHKLAAAVEIFLHQLLGVVDDTHGRDGVQAQMGAHQQGLWVGVADAADPRVAMKFRQILLKLGAEWGVLNGVDLPLEAVLRVIDNHTAPAGAQVGVVIHAEENVKGYVVLRDRAKKTAHV